MKRRALLVGIPFLCFFLLIIGCVIYIKLTAIDHEVRQGSAYGFTIGDDNKVVSKLVEKYVTEGRFDDLLSAGYYRIMMQERIMEPDSKNSYTYEMPKKAFEQKVWILSYQHHDWLIPGTNNVDVLELEFVDRKLFSIRRYRNYFVM